jgi:glucan phosphoethanolaminetransferase (alkaline phosphatase superfamily)
LRLTPFYRAALWSGNNVCRKSGFGQCLADGVIGAAALNIYPSCFDINVHYGVFIKVFDGGSNGASAAATGHVLYVILHLVLLILWLLVSIL